MRKDDFNQEYKREKVLLVIAINKKKEVWSEGEVLGEMKELVCACGGEVVDSIVCRVEKFSPKSLVGEGKVEEIEKTCQLHPLDIIIFSHDLKGNQQRNLEDALKVKTIDRTQLILDIFARHAKSKEGKMQVELAQLEYLLPRLSGKGIELSRLGGGIGTLGPGETKLETDRRKIFQRITRLKGDLKEISENRLLKRKKREHQGIPTIALVGYTNAGKSTLLNALTQAGQKTRDGLFTTLDSLSRQFILPNHQKVVLSDTVGFIHQLPHHLIESFKATLEDVKEADLLLHVLDISSPYHRFFNKSVFDVLKDLGVHEKPMIIVLNKIDQVKDETSLLKFQRDYKNSVCISAKIGSNMDQLNDKIKQMLSFLLTEVDVNLPVDCIQMVNLVHEKGEVYSVKYYPEEINIRASVPLPLAGQLLKKNIKKENKF